jgi:hypothetical protein
MSNWYWFLLRMNNMTPSKSLFYKSIAMRNADEASERHLM